MKEQIITQIQSMRIIVHQLLNIDQSHLDEEQTADIEHILSALDLIETLTYLLNVIPKTDEKRMQVLHDFTSPINGIIGYLYILEQEYSSSLTQNQHQLIQSLDVKIQKLYGYISKHLLSS
mgnify:CR=1 FL=1|jgi:hypothetical protein